MQPCSSIIYSRIKATDPRVLRHHEPLAFEYRARNGQFIGTIFLWQNLDRSPVSESATKLIQHLHDFIVFALEDGVARTSLHRPIFRGFFRAMAQLVESLELPDSEARVVGHLLLGRSYDEVADTMQLSINTVRRYIKNVYRKGGVRSIGELYAKYFLPWPA
jgi:DNA-binding CsgD family transcriptional regulator